MTRKLIFILLISCSAIFAQDALKLWGSFTAKESAVLQEILEEFKDETGVLVELKAKIDAPNLLEASYDLDVIVADIPSTIELAQQDLIIPLDEVISSEVTDNLIGNLVKAFKYRSALYGIPKSFDTLALFYNPNIFDEEGVDVPTNDWTWEDFSQAAEQLVEKGYSKSSFSETNINRASAVVSSETFGFLPYLLSYNKLDEEEIVARAVETYLSWRQAGLINTSDEVAAGWAGEIFISGQVAMTIEGSWLNGYARRIDPDFIYKAVAIPKNPETNEQGNILFAAAYLITKVAEENGKKELAQNLIEFLSQERNQQRIFEQAGILPTHKNLQEQLLSDDILGTVYKSIEQALPITYDISDSTLESLTNYTHEQISDIKSPEGQLAIAETQRLLAEIDNDSSTMRELDEEIIAIQSTILPRFPLALDTFPVEEVEVRLSVPYIHQLWDTPEGFDGSWASLPTCAAMVLAYYGLLEPKPIGLSEPEEHTSNYGHYIANAFTQNNYLFDTEARTKTGKAAGLYGAIVNNNGDGILNEEDSTLGLIETLERLMGEGYDISPQYRPKRVDSVRYMERKFAEELMKESLDAENPIIVSSDLAFSFPVDNGTDTTYTYRHFVVVSGYYQDEVTNELIWIVNDPYGFTVDNEAKTVTGEYDGANKAYSFNQINPKYMVVIKKQ